MPMTEGNHELEQRSHVLPADREHSLRDWTDVEPVEGADWGADNPFAQAADRWFAGAGGSLDDFLGEDGTGESSGLAKELALAQEGLGSVSRRRGSLEVVTVDDFDPGAQQSAFLIVKANKEALFSRRVRVDQRRRALEFFFMDRVGDARVGFADCCEVLEARVDVLRCRIQYEWYLRGTVFLHPFPFEVCDLPEPLFNPVHFVGGTLGYELVSQVWRHPGVHTDTLVQSVFSQQPKPDDRLGSDLLVSLRRLESDGVISHVHGWHVTPRNPLGKSMARSDHLNMSTIFGGTVSWSSLFGPDWG